MSIDKDTVKWIMTMVIILTMALSFAILTGAGHIASAIRDVAREMYYTRNGTQGGLEP